MKLLAIYKSTDVGQRFKTKTLRIMKLTAIILLVACLQVSARSSAQNITLSEKNVSLEKILTEVSKQSGYDFWYENKLLLRSNKVDIKVVNATLEEVMDVCFKNQPLTWAIVGKIIVIKKKEFINTSFVTTTKAEVINLEKVKGTVTGDNGLPLAGATIIVKGSNAATRTDNSGNFEIDVEPGSTIVITYVGHETQQIKIGKEKSLTVSLKLSTASQGEAIVVIGYGTQKKKEITASVSTVKKEDFNQGFNRDAAQLIQGKAAGVNIVQPSGNPLAGSQIYIRGRQSLFAGEDGALVIIDGVPSSLSLIAPEDIESVDILKDGAASAIYGVRGSNGVILITTKKGGTAFKNNVEYSSYVTSERFVKTLPLLNAAEYREKLAAGLFFKGEDLGASTDWLKESTRSPISHVHNLTFRGGNSKTNYMANVNYRSLQGVFLKSDVNNLRIRTEVNQSLFNDIVKVNLGLIRNSSEFFRLTDYSGFNLEYSDYDYVYRAATIRNPTAPLKDTSGQWSGNYNIQGYFNPVGWIKETDSKVTNQETRTFGNITIRPVKELRLNALLSRTQFSETSGFFQTTNHPYSVAGGIGGYGSRNAQQTTENLLELTAEYAKVINAHNFKVLGGYAYQDRNTDAFNGRTRDFINNNFSFYLPQNASGIGQFQFPLNGSKLETNLIGYFGRVNYSYADKYFVMASIRREASSKLVGAEKPWGNFPAVSAGWRISKEKFMSNIKFLNELKLRASYGKTGAEPKEAFLALQRYTYGFLLNPATGTLVPALNFASNPNQKLRWEEKTEYNIGLDFGIIGNKITGSVDYYNRTTNGLLYLFPVSPTSNLLPNTWANAGKIVNKGIELAVNANIFQSKNFTWSSNFNIARNSNNVSSIRSDINKDTSISFFLTGNTGEPIGLNTHKVEVGQPLGNFYGYQVTDITDKGEWVYSDKDGKPISAAQRTPDDRKILGNGIPKVILGFNNTIRYKNFDLSIYLRGAFGFQILNAPRMFYENRKTDKHRNVLKSSFDKVFGKAIISKTADPDYNSYYIEDGDYVKINNLTIGYNFKFKGVNSARIYVAGTNLLTFTRYSGIDPEVDLYGNGLTPGIDYRDRFPTTRGFTFGLNVNF